MRGPRATSPPGRGPTPMWVQSVRCWPAPVATSCSRRPSPAPGAGCWPSADAPLFRSYEILTPVQAGPSHKCGWGWRGSGQGGLLFEVDAGLVADQQAAGFGGDVPLQAPLLPADLGGGAEAD